MIECLIIFIVIVHWETWLLHSEKCSIQEVNSFWKVQFLKNIYPWLSFQQWKPEAYLRQAPQARCGPKCSHPKVNISRRALTVLDQVYIVPQVCSPYWSNRDPWADSSSCYLILAALIWGNLLYFWRIKTPGYYFSNKGPKPTSQRASGQLSFRTFVTKDRNKRPLWSC